MAQDAERLARFEREAKVLASLNHPNIAQIYELEDGAPANIMITTAGVAKVLDFGLAAVAQASRPVSGDPSISPTMTMRATQVATGYRR